MILLTLSTEHVRNTVITNEQGQAIYKTATPSRLVGTRTTTIQKIKPNDNQDHMRDQFDVLGEIEWHTFVSSKFRSHGTEVKTDVFIPKRGLWGRKRVFTGPDGRPYRWDLTSRVVVGILGRKRKATLEVSPEVAHMMDTVIMTFIYVEQLRKDKEEASRRAAASNANARYQMGLTN
ncbi:hypothetical protein EV424DRAFT_1348440 [Suillus variegatus]|nr:hypothetical protein EV424DRAFT_1348440 [Suillus variegatus]